MTQTPLQARLQQVTQPEARPRPSREPLAAGRHAQHGGRTQRSAGSAVPVDEAPAELEAQTTLSAEDLSLYRWQLVRRLRQLAPAELVQAERLRGALVLRLVNGPAPQVSIHHSSGNAELDALLLRIVRQGVAQLPMPTMPGGHPYTLPLEFVFGEAGA